MIQQQKTTHKYLACCFHPLVVITAGLSLKVKGHRFKFVRMRTSSSFHVCFALDCCSAEEIESELCMLVGSQKKRRGMMGEMGRIAESIIRVCRSREWLSFVQMTATHSSELQWLLVRNSSCFLIRRKRAKAATFTTVYLLKRLYG